ncbi:MAG TPA: aldehyde dehydrogenase family protein, partial [Thermodesulfobacteriota bacterium]|nr:aldehyde dehydrogenase family protein [Thermodesulfobacteriota bacterium]
MSREYGFLVNGEWLKSKKKREIKSPYNGETAGIVNIPDRETATGSIGPAYEAFSKWRESPSHVRSRILRKIADGIAARKEEFAKTLVLEGGKPLKTARVEVDRAVTTFSVAAEEANRIREGELVPIDIAPGNEGMLGIARRFPLGVVVGISPFNFPLNLVAHKVAPSIASGNAMILKPASQTPLSALILGETAVEAGLPDGLLNILPLSGADVEPVIDDERVKKVSFTGSDAIGWELKKKYPKKRVTLELGGNAATIIDEDPPDLDFAASRNAWGAFYQAGQSCISVQRMYVHEKIFDKFIGKFVEATRKLKLGDPMLEATDVGPVIDTQSADRIMVWIEDALANGAKLLSGGNRDGSLIEPTILTGVPPGCDVSKSEVFGPVVHVERYRDFDDALKEVNDSRYG